MHSRCNLLASEGVGCATAFVGYQYALPFMGGVFERPEATIAVDLAGLAPLLDADTVFVSHSPALEILRRR